MRRVWQPPPRGQPQPAAQGPVEQPTESAEALSSWTEGPTRDAILDFVARVTDPASPDFVPKVPLNLWQSPGMQVRHVLVIVLSEEGGGFYPQRPISGYSARRREEVYSRQT